MTLSCYLQSIAVGSAHTSCALTVIGISPSSVSPLFRAGELPLGVRECQVRVLRPGLC